MRHWYCITGQVAKSEHVCDLSLISDLSQKFKHDLWRVKSETAPHPRSLYSSYWYINLCCSMKSTCKRLFHKCILILHWVVKQIITIMTSVILKQKDEKKIEKGKKQSGKHIHVLCHPIIKSFAHRKGWTIWTKNLRNNTVIQTNCTARFHNMVQYYLI